MVSAMGLRVRLRRRKLKKRIGEISPEAGDLRKVDWQGLRAKVTQERQGFVRFLDDMLALAVESPAAKKMIAEGTRNGKIDMRILEKLKPRQRVLAERMGKIEELMGLPTGIFGKRGEIRTREGLLRMAERRVEILNKPLQRLVFGGPNYIEEIREASRAVETNQIHLRRVEAEFAKMLEQALAKQKR